jgi:hypothetical protein
MPKYKTVVTIDTLDSGKQYYTSGILQGYVPTETDFTYTAKVGDRWDFISNLYYGSSKYWYVLARANNGLDGSLFIKSGTKITIPQDL